MGKIEKDGLVAHVSDPPDPVTCPVCGNLAQWRGSLWRCKAGHETHRKRK